MRFFNTQINEKKNIKQPYKKDEEFNDDIKKDTKKSDNETVDNIVPPNRELPSVNNGQEIYNDDVEPNKYLDPNAPLVLPENKPTQTSNDQNTVPENIAPYNDDPAQQMAPYDQSYIQPSVDTQQMLPQDPMTSGQIPATYAQNNIQQPVLPPEPQYNQMQQPVPPVDPMAQAPIPGTQPPMQDPLSYYNDDPYAMPQTPGSVDPYTGMPMGMNTGDETLTGEKSNSVPFTYKNELSPSKHAQLESLNNIYNDLTQIRKILSLQAGVKYLNIKNKLDEALDFYKIVLTNLDSYEENLDEFIIKYKNFILVLSVELSRMIGVKNSKDISKSKNKS